MRQVAGRAGRFGSVFPDGRVTCLRSRDMGALRRKLRGPLPERVKAGLLPSTEQLGFGPLLGAGASGEAGGTCAGSQ